jgi:hypothetical protein
VTEALDDNGAAPLRTVRTTGPRAWVPRARAERRSVERLRFLEEEGVIVLNDRRAPGSKRCIEGIAVSPAGVFVIDTKPFKGLVHTKRPGPVASLGPPELHVGRRNCTSSLEELAQLVEVVRSSLDEAPYGGEIPVQGMLCLPRAAWGFKSAVEIRDLWIGWPQLMPDRIRAGGIMDSPTVREVSVRIADHLPIA